MPEEPCPDCGGDSTVVTPAVAVCGNFDCDVMTFRLDRSDRPGLDMLRD